MDAKKNKKLRTIMYVCIMLHNMIIEDQVQVICEFNKNVFNRLSSHKKLVKYKE